MHHLASDPAGVRRFLERLQSSGDIQCYYEAGPNGFCLQRHLTAHGIACDVIAPALMPRRAGDRVKTDRRDARDLAILGRAGALVAVRVPTELEEAVRDLLRCREAIVGDLLRVRHRLLKFLTRHGRRFSDTRAWSQRHMTWLRTQTWPIPALTDTFTAYLRAVDETHAQLQTINQQLQAVMDLEPLRRRAVPLRCFRGIDTLTALTVAAEVGDAKRFPSARHLMAFAGLIPSEHSSGETRRRGAITKTGNAHLRRVLIEAAWHYCRPPAVGRALRVRQASADDATIRHAWKAQHRLHHRYRRLVARGKSPSAAVTAIARELTGFVWAVLQ
jgi:transposase